MLSELKREWQKTDKNEQERKQNERLKAKEKFKTS